ncbi:shikimate dehydrogenase [Palleronia aestuarii]|uniref:Shikimate dehydrogenase (NADP(+)) n=1 Tax=Palleronia aestuarii TaxID=568105 RepID=A0A2W7NEX1_9RHOB|nr:shikimate dehydrogenase [Palleronia aestuarii]PZX18975.1 shikimate dehydrogenase [Palleronia aestuarii]
MRPDHVPLAGVIGTSVAQSASPKLHRFWLDRLGIAGHYVPLQIESQDLERIVSLLPRMGFVGANVTIPYKEQVLELADSVSDRTRRIGAANTLRFLDDGALHADNTDGEGFIENLRQGAPGWTASDGPAAVFGAGGAARAVIVSLLDAGAPEIRLSNRTRDRSEALRKEFGPAIMVQDWPSAEDMLPEVALVVNTTSLGMTGKAPFPFELRNLPETALACDIVYTPLDTPFLQAARRRGCRGVDGLGMLLHQAVAGFEAWFGTRPVVDAAARNAILSS